MKRLLLSALFFGLPAQSVMADDLYGDSAACAAGSNSPAALVYFEGMKDRKGKIRLELFPANDKDFLADDVVLQKAGTRASNLPYRCRCVPGRLSTVYQSGSCG